MMKNGKLLVAPALLWLSIFFVIPLLIVRYIDEGQTQTALKVFQFQLQVFAQLVIQRAQRLVQ